MSLADPILGLRARLVSDAAITALIGSGSAARAYAMKLPQSEIRPSLVYSRVSALGDHHMQGPSGLAQQRIQIDAWAQSIDTADQLARAVKERLDGFSGSILWGELSPAEAIVVQGIFFDSQREDWDEVAKLYRSSADYIVWFEER